MNTNAAAIAIRPIGTLMKKIQFQLMCSEMRPPTSGPIASASAETPAQMPIAVPRCARRERDGDDRERRRVHQRRAEALDDARADQDRRLRASPQASDAAVKIDEADDEDPPPAEQVGELAAGEHERAEGQRVAGDDPLELGHLEIERVLDRRQRHVHDGVVEHDHEEAERHRRERPPLPVLVCEDLAFIRVPFAFKAFWLVSRC